MKRTYLLLSVLPALVIALVAAKLTTQGAAPSLVGSAENNSEQMIQQGRQIFRFDTFGDQAFWGEQLKLHQTINSLTPK
jgi:hypothetical protein